MTEQQIQIFTTADGQAQLEVMLEQETIWLSQAQMGQLFDTTPENVLMHLKNIFSSAELAEEATTYAYEYIHFYNGHPDSLGRYPSRAGSHDIAKYYQKSDQ